MTSTRWCVLVAAGVVALSACTASTGDDASSGPTGSVDLVPIEPTTVTQPATVPTTLPADLPTLEEVETSAANVLPVSVQWRTELSPNCGPVDEVLPGLRFSGSAPLESADDAAVAALADEAAANGAEVMRSPQGVLTLRAEGWQARVLVDDGTDPPSGVLEVEAIVDELAVPAGFGRDGFCG